LLKATPLAAAAFLSAGGRQAPAARETQRDGADQPAKVLVWDEQQPAQKQASHALLVQAEVPRWTCNGDHPFTALLFPGLSW
jgi:hypothetical protein